MRVLAITPVGEYVGGAERSGYWSVRAMIDAGWDVHVITSNTGEYARDLEELGANMTFTGGKDVVLGKCNLFPAAVIQIWRNLLISVLLLRHDFDMVYMNSKAGVEWGLIPCLLSGARIAIHCRGAGNRGARKLLLRLFGPGVDMIFNSRYAGQITTRATGDPGWRRHTVLYNPIDPEKFRPLEEGAIAECREELGLSPESFVIVMVARICDWKHHDTLLEAVQALPQKANLHCLIVGAANSPAGEALRAELENFVAEHDLEEVVEFMGFRSDVDRIMAISDLCVLPSVGEPFGRVVVEAAACGTPVIAAESGGIPEIYEHGEIGELFEPLNSEELSEKITGLRDDPERRERLARGARRTAQDFTPNKLGRHLLKYLSERGMEWDC